MKVRTILRWTLLIAGSVILLLLMAVAVIVTPTCRRASAGVEYAPSRMAPQILAHFRDSIGWTNLSETDIERVWAHGLRDTLMLCRMRLDADQFTSLRRCVAASTNDFIRVDDSDKRSLCPFGLATDAADPTLAKRIPRWWEVASLPRFDGLLWESTTGAWSWWFAYHSESNLLYVLGLEM